MEFTSMAFSLKVGEVGGLGVWWFELWKHLWKHLWTRCLLSSLPRVVMLLVSLTSRCTLGLCHPHGAPWLALLNHGTWFVIFLTHLAVAFQVQESQPKVLFTDLPPLWFLPVKEADKTNHNLRQKWTEMDRRIEKLIEKDRTGKTCTWWRPRTESHTRWADLARIGSPTPETTGAQRTRRTGNEEIRLQVWQ